MKKKKAKLEKKKESNFGKKRKKNTVNDVGEQ